MRHPISSESIKGFVRDNGTEYDVMTLAQALLLRGFNVNNLECDSYTKESAKETLVAWFPQVAPLHEGKSHVFCSGSVLFTFVVVEPLAARHQREGKETEHRCIARSYYVVADIKTTEHSDKHGAWKTTDVIFKLVMPAN